MITKVLLSTDVTDPIYFGFAGNYLPWLLSRCQFSLGNAVAILSPHFQSVVDSGKIGEEVFAKSEERCEHSFLGFLSMFSSILCSEVDSLTNSKVDA
ncbi:hypothetical protein AVEN_71132-1 [Araneus ventricosus]|uniref:Uncharacterized protein n=1 Tax=Araneus ventricosus TaxID=182803 RepID=A0A4Y2HJA2_ARAVE|nr:hypothetical protein AVEN_71132-1 [Araneus ventricosus]